MLHINEYDLDRIVIKHDNKFAMINTRLFELGTNTYVLPSQCEQVLYPYVPNKVGWSYVVRHESRGRLVKYIVLKNANIEEDKEDDVEAKVHVSEQVVKRI